MSDETENKGLPYGADYAKTGRSSCKDKDCIDKNIEANDLRLSFRTKSNFHEGLQDNWFHFECFWKRARKGINEASIRHFEHLRWDDQERIRARIKHKDAFVDDIRAEKNAKVEYAKTGKSTCSDCKEKLNLDELRIDFHSKFHHAKCLADTHIYKKKAEEIDGFDELDDEDKDLLRGLFIGKTAEDLRKEEAGMDDEMTLEDLKEASNDGMDEDGMKKLKALEERKEALKKQTNLIWEVREAIENAMLKEKIKTAKAKKEFVENLIKANGGNVYKKSTLDDGIQFLADIIVFGGFDKCPTCSSANFYYSADRRVYQCAGNEDAGERCSYFSREIKRVPFNADGNEVLSDYDEKQLLPEGRVYSKSVEEHVEEERLVLTAPQPAKKIDPTRKRKNAESEGVMKPNGFSIDPYFSAADDFHVYVDEDGVPYQFLSHKTDPKTGDIKFYKLQLLEEDGDGSEVYLFRRYGVVLTDSTKDQKNVQKTMEVGIREFSKLFLEKTGHAWPDFSSKKDLKPKEGKYQVVEWDTNLGGSYGRTTVETQADENVVSQKKTKKTKKEIKKEEEESD